MLLAPSLLELLEHSGATGMFVVFGGLDESRHEMLYLRDTKPRVVELSYSDVVFHRGRCEIAKAFGLPVTSLWKTGFEAGADDGFYRIPLEALAAERRNGVDDYGYFHGMFSLAKNDSSILTYTLPVVSKDGTVLGIFGIELSEHHLRLFMPPEEIPFATGVYLLGNTDKENNAIVADAAMLSGGYGRLMKYQDKMFMPEDFSIHGNELYRLKLADGKTMIGAAARISLYDTDDYFSTENNWKLIGLVNDQSFYLAANRIRLSFCLWIGIVMLLNIAAIFIIGKRMSKPVSILSRELKKMREDLTYKPNQTDVAELDELMELFASAPPASLALAGGLPPDLLSGFIQRTKTLTKAEQRIFMLYMEGHTIRDIPDLTFTSINTVKKHNQHIYEKLNISSRDELLLYVNLLRGSDQLSQIF